MHRTPPITVENCASGANIIQRNPCGYGIGDKAWRDAPEISIKADLTIAFYIGGRTINGVFNPSATYNNGISGADTQQLTGLNSNSWDPYTSVSFTVYLNAGQNTTTFGNASYYAPDIDRIGVSKTAK